MADSANPNDPEGHNPPEGFSQQGFQHTPVGARVPEDIGRGVFANATMILQSRDEFIVDFLGTMVQPQQIVARVVLTPQTFAQLIGALRENMGIYESHFGRLAPREIAMAPPQASRPSDVPPPPATPEAIVAPWDTVSEIVPQEMPAAPGGSQSPPAPPTIEDLYGQLKLSDKMLSGVFANMVMIRHMGEEFCLDFVANFYPRPVVTARIFMAAGRVPSLLGAMENAMAMYRQRMSGGPPPAR